MSKIIKLTNIMNIVKKEKMDICVISYGGCASNTLVKRLEDNGYKCKTESWKKLLCHCPKFIDIDIPIIYIFENPIKAFLSQKRRKGVWSVNQEKMSNNKNIKDKSDENLLRLMIKQFKVWIKHEQKPNVLVLNTSEIFSSSIVNCLQNFLKKKHLKYFPIPYREPSINIKIIQHLDYTYVYLFNKYKNQINMIITKGNEILSKRLISYCKYVLNKHKTLLNTSKNVSNDVSSIKLENTIQLIDDNTIQHNSLLEESLSDESLSDESLSDESLSDESLSDDILQNESLNINLTSENALMEKTNYVITEPITLSLNIS